MEVKMIALFNHLKILIAFIILLFTSLVHAANAPFPAQMIMDIYYSPRPMKADNKYYLVYEIYLTNAMKSKAKIITFNVRDDKNTQLLSLNDLKTSIQARGDQNQKNIFTFQPGEMKTIFVWIPFKNESNLPAKLIHTMSVDSDFKNKPYTFELGSYQLKVNNITPAIIDSPLRGKNWLAGNAPSNTSGHRRTAIIFNGKPYYAQRYAIDFIQMGSDGKSYVGNVHDNKSYHCYNQDLHAVADGTVVELQDGIPENIPNSNQYAVTINEKTLAGNHIVIDIGNGRYAGYAHIIPGSFKVKLGDHVTRNQVIAKLGNSGNSTEPHLHFQVTNNKKFVEADGIPYGFNHFFAHPAQLLDDPSGILKIKVTHDTFKEYSNQLVLENALINFD